MASFLKPFKFAWKELDQALNRIVDVVNANAPLEGTGIYLDEKGGQGVSINRSDTKGSSGNSSGGQQQQQGGGGGITAPTGEAASWQQINVVDQNCNQYTMYVWGTPPKLIL